jgi:uncharacterized protein (DUF885 family)
VTTPFADLADTIVDGWLACHPTEATYLGDHSYDHLLEDPSAEAARQRRTEIRAHLVALEGMAVTGADEEVDRAVLRTNLRAELLELERIDSASWDPMQYNPGQAIYHLGFAFAPAAERLDSARARLAAVPGYLAAARERLGEMSRLHTRTAVDQLTGTIALIGELIPALAAEAGRDAPDTDGAVTALAEHRDWLAARVESAGREPRLGAGLFADKLALTLDTEFEPRALAEQAEADLDRLGAEIRAAAGRFAGVATPSTDTVRAVLAELADEMPTSETVLGLCRDALAEATAFVRSRDLVTVYDDPIDVVEMPEIDRGVAGAYCRPSGPLETTPVPTQFAVSPAPADWTPEQVRSFFREDNAHMLHDLTVHEAMPGHALQLMHSNRGRASRARRVFESGTFIEGWAVYAEELMAGAGYRSGVSERAADGLRMQQLKMQLRSTLNAILDIRYHCADLFGALDEDEAMSLMTGRAFQEHSEAAGKWRRVQLTSTQLCTYYVGYREIRDLAGAVRAAHPGWSSRQVHDAMLSFGSPPPRHVRTLLELA